MDQKEKELLFVKIATWELAGMAQVQIAELLSVDASRISQLITLPEYANIKMNLAAQQAERDGRYNDLWDVNEENALKIVKKTLEVAPRDGEFALRVAAVANRARRRGSQSNGITAQQGMRAAVTLPLSFVRKLEAKNGEMSITEEHYGAEQLPQQNINILKPAEVERIFGGQAAITKEKKTTKDILGDLELNF